MKDLDIGYTGSFLQSLKFETVGGLAGGKYLSYPLQHLYGTYFTAGLPRECLKKKKRKLKKKTLYGIYLYASTPVSGRLEAGKSPSSCIPVLTQKRFTAGVEV